MKIIQKLPNPSGGYPPIQNWSGEIPPNYAEINLDLTEFNAYNGFVTLEIENDIVTSYVPNLEAWNAWKPNPIIEAKENAISRITGKCSGAISGGVDVNGKRYSLSIPLGQMNLTNAMAEADRGETIIPYSAIGEESTAYTPEQIRIIAKSAKSWGLVNTQYYGKLKKWIARETDVEMLNSIEYGCKLPYDLMDELTKELEQFGVDIYNYIFMIGG